MNFNDTLASVDLVLATGEVPLIVGESGIGKTALAKQIALQKEWSLVVIDGNLLKEGEIGGLPTIETYATGNGRDQETLQKITVYAIHHKLKEINSEINKGRTVLLFIDEINRCEHTVQQELMNLILNREINDYQLPENVHILAAMNPSAKYGLDYDYQVVDMDPAQENRFVWLFMEPDPLQWLDWAQEILLEEKVIEFIATFPENLMKRNPEDISATPRSYERVSKVFKQYQQSAGAIPKRILMNVLEGNVGKLIAAEFYNFVQAEHKPLLSFEDVFSGKLDLEELTLRLEGESHTRLYITAKNLLKKLEAGIREESLEVNAALSRLIEFLNLFPVDLRVGIMKDMKGGYTKLYDAAIKEEGFVELYFTAML